MATRRRSTAKRAPTKKASSRATPGPSIAEVSTTHEFSAAHRLRSAHLSASENRALFGPCADVHGHTYHLEVTVRGPVDARTGMVIDLYRLRRLVQARVVSQLDHRHLDRDVPFLTGQITTIENLCRAIWRRLEPSLRAADGARLHRVSLGEGDLARATVTSD